MRTDTFRLHCETCPFETEAETVPEALALERRHKRREPGRHRMTIERSPDRNHRR